MNTASAPINPALPSSPGSADAAPGPGTSASVLTSCVCQTSVAPRAC